MSKLSNLCEAILFLKGEPVSLKEIERLLEKGTEEIKEALSGLRENLSLRGIRLLEDNEKYTLVTAPEIGSVVKKLAEESSNPEIGKAGIETLAIILYRAPITRAEIDYIRGVNSSFTLRSLLIRGLIERKPHTEDDRVYLYEPSLALFQHLGITEREGLPQYQIVKEEIAKIFENGEK